MMRGALAILVLALSLQATAAQESATAAPGNHERIDPAFDTIIDSTAPVELLASGYGFTEGPVWMPQLHALLFSDLPGNVVHRYDPRSGKASVHLLNAGFTGPDLWRWGGLNDNSLGAGRGLSRPALQRHE
jgi:gluconolactonase